METSAANPMAESTWSRVLHRAVTGLRELRQMQRRRRSLLVRETAALGERRFVAVVQFEQQRYLIGASAGSVTLLAQLPDANPGDGEQGCIGGR